MPPSLISRDQRLPRLVINPRPFVLIDRRLRSSMCGNRGYAGDARVTLLREKGVIDELQTHGAPDQPAGTAGKQAHQKIRAPTE